MKKILLLDNYDSFTYNLVQYIEEITGYGIDVIRNDKITVEQVSSYDIIFLSPGPGVPKDAGILIDVIREYSGKRPIFGVCLGLQAMSEAFGGSLTNLKRVYHGIATEVKVEQKDSLFNGLETPFMAGRYHSWVATENDLPDCFTITAVDVNENEIMAISHNEHLTKAVQFHPESILTPNGKEILRNFLIEAKAIEA